MKRRVLVLLVMVLLFPLLSQAAWGIEGSGRGVRVSHHLWQNRAEFEINFEGLSWARGSVIEVGYSVECITGTGDRLLVFTDEALVLPIQPQIRLVADWEPNEEDVSEEGSLLVISTLTIYLRTDPESSFYALHLGTYHGWVASPPRYVGPVEISVKVVDHYDRVVEGANVEIGAYVEERDPHFEEIPGVTVSRKTDENGKVSFTVPAPTKELTYGTRTTYEEETGKKYEETSSVFVGNEGKFSAWVSLRGLCLKPTERVVVSVTDGNGQPVNGATVYLGRRVGFLEFTRFDMPSKLTADDGSVVFESIPDLCILFTAEASFRGHKSTSLYSRVQDGTQLLQVNLSDLRLSE